MEIGNTNSTAFGVWSNFTQNMTAMRSSMTKLSTGQKSVVDNASGVGISERLRAQARSSAMARQNVDNAISFTQTADAWMQKFSDLLARMSELSIAANDGTKTDIDKENIKIEFRQMQDEIARVTSKSTAAGKFNGLYLFRGGSGVAVQSGDRIESGSIKVQIGSDLNQTIDVDIKDLQLTSTEIIGTVTTYSYNTNNLATASTRTSVQWSEVIDSTRFSASSTNAVGKIALAIDHIAASRAALGSQQSRLINAKQGVLMYEDNLRAAEQGIRGVDMARESTNLANAQILTQVGTAMLTQANQLNQQVLQLLG